MISMFLEMNRNLPAIPATVVPNLRRRIPVSFSTSLANVNKNKPTVKFLNRSSVIESQNKAEQSKPISGTIPKATDKEYGSKPLLNRNIKTTSFKR